MADPVCPMSGSLFDVGGDETPRAHARRDDPETSHEAAWRVGDLTDRQQAVLAVVQVVGPATHDAIVDAYRNVPGLPAQTDQSIRSRCAELVDGKLVEAFDREGTTSNGGRATRWRVIPGEW